LKWDLSNFLPTLASNQPISASQAPRIKSISHGIWLLCAFA
jgi:hypothetical protein